MKKKEEKVPFWPKEQKTGEDFFFFFLRAAAVFVLVGSFLGEFENFFLQHILPLSNFSHSTQRRTPVRTTVVVWVNACHAIANRP